MYSGAVAAYAYRALRGCAFDVAVLVGPSHYVGFDGVAIYDRGSFETPFGAIPVDEDCADAVSRSAACVKVVPAAHAREHSLEMQLPFLQRVLPGTPIVPLVMGQQRRDTAYELGDAIAAAVTGRRAVIVASTDLSHYQPATVALALDSKVIDRVGRFDTDGLMALLEAAPDHACGGGPTVSVMRAARRLGAADARVLKYGDSGDVSGDKSAVVGYMAAALARLAPATN